MSGTVLYVWMMRMRPAGGRAGPGPWRPFPQATPAMNEAELRLLAECVDIHNGQDRGWEHAVLAVRVADMWAAHPVHGLPGVPPAPPDVPPPAAERPDEDPSGEAT